MNRIIAFLAVLSLPLVTTAETLPQPEAAGLTAEGVAKLDSLIDGFLQHGMVAGGVAVVERNGATGYRRAFGVKSRDPEKPMQEDTIFRIFSMTKPVTSVAALMLFDEGKIGLDDPVEKYLPALADMKVGVETQDENGNATLELVPADHPPTIRELMSHTAGFAYGLTPSSEVERLYQAANLLRSDETSAEKIERLGQLPLEHQPGTQWDYSAATDVLGCVVEVVSGQSLADFFEERIFQPLGMVDTAFYVPEEKHERLSDVFSLSLLGGLQQSEEKERFRTKPMAFSGGGGLVSTAEDYMQFCRMLLNHGELDGVRLLRPETVTSNDNGCPGWPADIADRVHPGDVGGGFRLGGLGDDRAVLTKREARWESTTGAGPPARCSGSIRKRNSLACI